MLRSPRLRSFVLCIVILAIFGLVFHRSLDERFMGDGELFLGAVALVILATGLYFEPRRTGVRLSWAILAPIAASVIGYAVFAATVYSKRGHLGPNVSIVSWALVGVGYPYIVCNVWTLSVALPILSSVNHHLHAFTHGSGKPANH